MLNENSHEAFNRSEDGSVNNDRSLKSGFEGFLLPSEIFIIILIFLEELFSHDLLGHLSLVSFSISLLSSSVLALILQVKADREVEIALNSPALMRSLKGIVDFDVNFRSIKRAITSV